MLKLELEYRFVDLKQRRISLWLIYKIYLQIFQRFFQFFNFSDVFKEYKKGAPDSNELKGVRSWNNTPPGMQRRSDVVSYRLRRLGPY